jgi:gluconate 2-dehydrogenase gamma chain
VSDLAVQALEHPQGRAPLSKSVGWKPKVLTPHHNETVTTIAELIIPQTDTPGARAARVNEFIDEVLADAVPGIRNKFLNGLSWIDQRSRSRYGVDFIGATTEQQVALLTPLGRPVQAAAPAKREKESAYVPAEPLQQDRAAAPPDQVALDFFESMKSLTITGYYTSEVGMKEELGDDAMMFFDDYPGCKDPGHGYDGSK